MSSTAHIFDPGKIVMMVPAGCDACALYRLFMPHLYLKNSRFVFQPEGTNIQEFFGCDVIVVQRQATELNFKALLRLRELGFRLVYDIDDNVWNIGGSNPVARIYREFEGGFEKCASLCEILVVSTQGLASAVRTALPRLGKPIIVIPNAADPRLLHKPILPKPLNRFTVGWGGSNTHSIDVKDAWGTLPGLLEELPELYLEFVGMLPPGSIIKHPRVRVRQFVPVAEFFARYSSWAWDVVLAPLEDSRFNRSKSSIKVLEASRIGAACLMSPVAPYLEFTQHDAELKWLLCRSANDWRTKIRELYHNRGMVTDLNAKMLAVTEKWFPIEASVARWSELLRAM